MSSDELVVLFDEILSGEKSSNSLLGLGLFELGVVEGLVNIITKQDYIPSGERYEYSDFRFNRGTRKKAFQVLRMILCNHLKAILKMPGGMISLVDTGDLNTKIQEFLLAILEGKKTPEPEEVSV
tara:strand:- start:1544 stop:1918 length:375 start_codon:yes stop_codon:yes gene_type:complete